MQNLFFKFVKWIRSYRRWGISSNGRAPASHAGGTGIDAWILHVFFFADDHSVKLFISFAAAVKVPGTERSISYNLNLLDCPVTLEE